MRSIQEVPDPETAPNCVIQRNLQERPIIIRSWGSLVESWDSCRDSVHCRTKQAGTNRLLERRATHKPSSKDQAETAHTFRTPAEMPRLKTCWACNIFSGSSDGSKRGWGGGRTRTKGTCFLGRSEGMPLQKFLKIWISKMAVSIILRQISYQFNTNFFAHKLCFCKKKYQKWGGGAAQAHQPPLPYQWI